MPVKSLKKLLKPWLDVCESSDREILGLSVKIEDIVAGHLFLALIGMKTTRSHIIQQAINQGAAAVLVETTQKEIALTLQNQIPIIYIPHLYNIYGKIAAEFFDHPSKKLKVIGVTGTNGKTSIAYYIATAFHLLGQKSAYIGTLGCGLYEEPFHDTGLTTPNAVFLQKTLAEFYEQNVKVVALEVSSAALTQGRINGVEFFSCVFTNLTHEHLDYHGSMLHYFLAKQRLFQSDFSQRFIINADDPYGAKLLAISNKNNTQDIIAYSIQPQDSQQLTSNTQYVIAKDIVESFENISAYIKTPRGEGNIKISLIGLFNLSNVLAVIGVLGLSGISFEQISLILPKLSGAPGRMQKFYAPQKPLVIVDFSHTPNALEKTLSTLKKFLTGQLWCVFGCNGGRDKLKRPLMGAIAEHFAHHIVLTNDNPREEDPVEIINNILEGMKTPERVIITHHRKAATYYAICNANQNDIVLITGNTYQCIGKKKYLYCDIDTVKKILTTSNPLKNVHT